MRLVLNCILLSVLLAFLAIGVGLLAGAMGPGTKPVTPAGPTFLMRAYAVLSPIVTLGIQLVMCWGYFLLSEPDPGYTGIEKPDSARAWLRRSVIATAAVSLVQTMLMIIQQVTAAPPFLGGILIATLILSMLAWAVQFFSMMQYVRGLAKRAPDEPMAQRANMYMWLLPVLYTVGTLICGLGPLIALVLYWNMLAALRKHVIAAIGVR
ncbi:MAG: hypothetical protein WC718_09125 [Phycisphaerales bacterium]|jgi:hypothetical protein